MIPRILSMTGAGLHAMGLWIFWIRLGLVLTVGVAISAHADPITLHTRWRTGSTNLAEATPQESAVTWEALSLKHIRRSRRIKTVKTRRLPIA